MSQEQEKPKILFLRKALTSDSPGIDADPWAPLRKALGSFCDPEERERDQIAFDEIVSAAESYSHIFLDFQLAPWEKISKTHIPKLCLVKETSFPWKPGELEKETSEGLSRQPCLVVDGLGASDLLRILHLYLLPKRTPGVAALMEKGSVIVGEKLLGLEHLGRLMDNLNAYLSQLGNFELISRLPDLRLVLTAFLFEAFQAAQRAGAQYPTVDFQVAAGARKIAINLRFPKGGLNARAIPGLAISGYDLRWQQVWRSSDVLIVTDHLQHEELEVTSLLFRPDRPPNDFRSFLFRESDNSARKESYLDPPQHFTFKVLSEIHPKESDVVIIEEKTDGQELDLGGLPEAVLKKIAKMSEQVSFLEDQLKRKELQLQETSTKLHNAAKDSSSKRAEILRIAKAKESEAEATKRKIEDLNEEIVFLKKEIEVTKTPKEQDNSAFLQEAIAKLEAALRAAENEKNQMKENIANEQKKVSVFEQKYSTLYKDMMSKEKEINDLKATVLKIRKDQSGDTGKATAPSSNDLATKLKETESRETALKQEVRKITFKLDSQEKNLKAIQTEIAEKSKLMEQKLQAAKAKEVELLKRVEELTAALKKATKAAA